MLERRCACVLLSLAMVVPVLACSSSDGRRERGTVTRDDGAPTKRRKKPAVIHIYHGFGTTAGAMLGGRVLEDKGDRMPRDRERWYRKWRRNLQALESDEIPYARVTVKVLKRTFTVKADKEGLFWLAIPGPLPEGKHPVTAELLGGRRRFRVEQGRLMIWPRKPGVAVISDIDDTVLQSGVRNKAKLAWRVLSTNARDLKTYPHAAALYRTWAKRGHPIVFVSGSPNNLYLKLRRFFSLKQFPQAPMLLKDFGISSKHGMSGKQMAYKMGHLNTVLKLLPGYRFILVGDSGEQDPEIYRALQQKIPKRVIAILINKVSRMPANNPRYRGQVLFASYLDVAWFLKRRGLLTEAEAQAVIKAR